MSVKTPTLSHAGSHNVYCELPFHTSERQYTTLKASTKKFISLGDLHYIAIVSLKEIFAAVNKRGMRFLTSNCQYFLQLQNLLTFSCNKRSFDWKMSHKNFHYSSWALQCLLWSSAFTLRHSSDGFSVFHVETANVGPIYTCLYFQGALATTTVTVLWRM